MRRRSRLLPFDPMGLVGWVFADLLLAIAIVFIATQPGDPFAGAGPDPTTTTTTTTSTTTTTTTTSTLPEVEPGVDTQYRCIRIQADPGRLDLQPGPGREAYGNELRDQLAGQLSTQGLDGRQAGIVLLFGTAENSGVGRDYASQFDALVLDRLPETFGGSARRAFWGGGPTEGAPTGSIELNIYPLVGPGQPPMGQPSEC